MELQLEIQENEYNGQFRCPECNTELVETDSTQIEDAGKHTGACPSCGVALEIIIEPKVCMNYRCKKYVPSVFTETKEGYYNVIYLDEKHPSMSYNSGYYAIISMVPDTKNPEKDMYKLCRIHKGGKLNLFNGAPSEMITGVHNKSLIETDMLIKKED